MRFARKYGPRSNPVISHVEQYRLQPANEKCFQLNDTSKMWEYNNSQAILNGQKFREWVSVIPHIKHQIRFSDNNGYPPRYENILIRDPQQPLSNSVHIDIVIAANNTTLDEQIDKSFDLTARQARMKVDGDIVVPFVRLALHRTTLLCPTCEHIVRMHYMISFIDNSCIPLKEAIQRFGIFSP